MHSQQKNRRRTLTVLSFIVLLAGLTSAMLVGGVSSFHAGADSTASTCTNPSTQTPADVGVPPECVINNGEIKLTDKQAESAGLQPKSADQFVGETLDGVYTIVAIIAVLVIVIAGIRIIIADGDASKVASARQSIIYSVVGLVIVGSAFIITGVVQGIGTK